MGLINIILMSFLIRLFINDIKLENILSWVTSIVISTVVLSFVCLLSLVFHLPFNIVLLILLIINILFLLVNIKSVRNLFVRCISIANREIYLLGIILISSILFVLASEPWGETDAWAIWSLHAKFLFFPEFWTNQFTNIIDWSHPDYPLLLSSIIAIFWNSTGEISAAIPALAAYVIFVFILLIIYACTFSHKNYLLATLVLAGIGMDVVFIGRAAFQYADTLLALFYLLSFVFYVRLGTTYNKKKLWLLGCFASLCPWIKNEGIVFFIFLSVAFILNYRKNFKFILAYLYGALIPILFFIAFKLGFAPDNDIMSSQGADTFNKIFSINRYLIVISSFFTTFLNSFLILILALCYALLFKRNNLFSLNMLIIVLTLGVYLFMYIITPNEIRWHISTSLDRLIIQLYPSVIFIAFGNDYLPQIGKENNNCSSTIHYT